MSRVLASSLSAKRECKGMPNPLTAEIASDSNPHTVNSAFASATIYTGSTDVSTLQTLKT